MSSEYADYLGLDVGKGGPHACASEPSGKRLHDKPLPNDEAKLRLQFDRLAEHDPVLRAVDQPASIGALPVVVARATGCQVAYLPGLTMRRLADPAPRAGQDRRPRRVGHRRRGSLAAVYAAAGRHRRRIDGELEVSVGLTTTWPPRPPASEIASAA